ARLVPRGAHGAGDLPTVRVEDVRLLALAAVVVVQHPELGAVDRHQVIDRDAGDDRHDRVDLHHRLPTVLVDPHRRGHLPFGADVAERGTVRTFEAAGPGVSNEGRVVGVAPEVSVRV